jgi:hypothetical protein
VSFEDEPPTRTGKRPPTGSALRVAKENEPIPGSIEFQVGQIMAATHANTRSIGAMTTSIGTLEREVTQLQRAIEQDRDVRKVERKVMVRTAARHSSNRAALLMGTLWGVYEIAAPYLRTLLRLFHK